MIATQDSKAIDITRTVMRVVIVIVTTILVDINTIIIYNFGNK
jgi:hypothetical protein